MMRAVREPAMVNPNLAGNRIDTARQSVIELSFHRLRGGVIR